MFLYSIALEPIEFLVKILSIILEDSASLICSDDKQEIEDKNERES